MLHAPVMNVRMPRITRRYGFHSNSNGRLVMSHELERIKAKPPNSILASGLAFNAFVNAKMSAPEGKLDGRSILIPSLCGRLPPVGFRWCLRRFR